MPHDDFQVEPVRGLPERPPEGERILWQGAPSARALARDALCIRWVAGYFALLAVWRGIVVAPTAAIPYALMGLVSCAILVIIALILAKTTVYTITNRRVAMRIGAALTVTLNIPFTRIASMDLEQRRDGTGTIALSLLGETRLSYLVCWPHVRPWRVSPTQPALRSIPEAARIAELLADTAYTRIAERDMANAAVATAAE